MIGIILEQHADRCRLFMQWQEMDWPIMVDPLNLARMTAVPIKIFIDEYGIVQAIQPRLGDVAQFVTGSFEKPQEMSDAQPAWDAAEPGRDLVEAGDAAFMWGGENKLGEAIKTYRAAARLDPDDPSIRFKLGVVHRRRFETEGREPSDFAMAVAEWSAALAADPNQYIWRRRIQQYGPRLDKPYPFYDWVPEARATITARGETPLELLVEPEGTELARPARQIEPSPAGQAEPDAEGKITRDTGLIEFEPIVVPHTSRRQNAWRVHLHFRPDEASAGHWNNEAEPMRVWIDIPKGWEIDQQFHQLANTNRAVSNELRKLEFEVRTGTSPEPGTTVSGYALFNVCEGDNGLCLYRRLDFSIPFD